MKGEQTGVVPHRRQYSRKGIVFVVLNWNVARHFSFM